MKHPSLARSALAGLMAGSVALIAGCGSGPSTATRAPAAPLTTTGAAVTSVPALTPASGVPSPGASVGGGPQKAVPPEQNPPGDIPDNLAFVLYRNPSGRYTFTHPEGWLEKSAAATVTFTDKLNGVQVMPGTQTSVPTVASAKVSDVPALTASQPAFELRGISAVSEPAGRGVRIVYRRNSAPDPVTGRQYRDEVERYQIVAGGREIVMELFGPVGADNVDAYRTMVQSLRLS
jgi:hypothetical protein